MHRSIHATRGRREHGLCHEETAGDKSHSGLIEPLQHADSHPWGLSARNLHQQFALELLLRPDIKLVTMLGQAGTGKTLLALAVGLQLVAEEKKYRRIMVSRPIMPLGRDIGYLPGTKEEKLPLESRTCSLVVSDESVRFFLTDLKRN